MNELYIYGAIIVLSLIIEASTTTLVAIWFVPGALAGIIMSLLNVSVSVQIAVFFTVSLLLMVLFYKKLRDIIEIKTEKTGIDAIIGKQAVAEENISFFKNGRVKVGGMSWSACVKEKDEEINKGDIVEITAIDGVKLVCTKIHTASLKKQINL